MMADDLDNLEGEVERLLKSLEQANRRTDALASDVAALELENDALGRENTSLRDELECLRGELTAAERRQDERAWERDR